MSKPHLSDSMIEEAGRNFNALSGSSCLKLLRLLRASPEPMSQANTRKHLVCLLQTGRVARKRDGHQAFFNLVGSLVPEASRIS